MVWTPVAPRYGTADPREESSPAATSSVAKRGTPITHTASAPGSGEPDKKVDPSVDISWNPRLFAAAGYGHDGSGGKASGAESLDTKLPTPASASLTPSVSSSDAEREAVSKAMRVSWPASVADRNSDEPALAGKAPQAPGPVVPRLRLSCLPGKERKPNAEDPPTFNARNSLPLEQWLRGEGEDGERCEESASCPPPPAAAAVPWEEVVEEHQRQLGLLTAATQELRGRLDRETREREIWERRALEAESTASRLVMDLEKLSEAAAESGLKAQLAAARNSLQHARSEAEQARHDADLAWHQVDAARNDAALVQEALLGLGGAAAPTGEDLSVSPEQLRAKDEEIDHLKEEIRLMAAAVEGMEEAATASAGMREEVAELRRENANLRKEVDAAMASAVKRDSGCAAAEGSQVGAAKGTCANDKLHEYAASLQKRIWELEHGLGVPASRVAALERELADEQKKVSKINVFVETFLYKAYRPLHIIDLVCRDLAMTLEAGFDGFAEIPSALYDPKSSDVPKSMANILFNARFYAQVLGSMSGKAQEYVSARQP